MKAAADICDTLGVPYEARVVSAHRTPDLLFDYAENAVRRGLAAIIAGAGGAAHLPGMLAAKTRLPVLGVPVPSKHLKGLDSLLSIVQMPRGVPVATFAIGEAGAANAALFAIAMIATGNDEAAQALASRLEDFRQQQRDKALAMTLPASSPPTAPATLSSPVPVMP
jgi:5-(carboxyamino)imidazole ribonucleotide mutase